MTMALKQHLRGDWLHPKGVLDPTQTLMHVCHTISWCLSGKHSSNIHIFSPRAGSLLWRKSGRLDAKRLTSSSQSPSALCHATYTLGRSSENCIFDLVNKRVCCFIACCDTGYRWNKKLKSQSRDVIFTPEPSNIEKVKQCHRARRGKSQVHVSKKTVLLSLWQARGSDSEERRRPRMLATLATCERINAVKDKWEHFRLVGATCSSDTMSAQKSITADTVHLEGGGEGGGVRSQNPYKDTSACVKRLHLLWTML